MQGAAQQKIHAIDQEIEAEKKRDGKSAASLAKNCSYGKEERADKEKSL